MIINITYGSSVDSAPAAFKTAVASAVSYLESQFNDPVTLNVTVGWGEVNGTTIDSGSLGQSVTLVYGVTYDQIRSALVADAKSADDTTAVNSLAASDPTGGNWWVASAEAKALGLAAQNDPSTDGYLGFSKTVTYDFDNTDGVSPGAYDFFSSFMHEITEVMGRSLLVGGMIGSTPDGYHPLDMFHFSAAGTRDFSGATAGYFSIDGGVTNLDNFNTDSTGDFGDWAASAGHDAFVAFGGSGVVEAVSATDLREMDILGWDRVTTPPPTTSPNLKPSSFAFDGVTASWRVDNIGDGAAGASTAGVYLSADASITTADRLVGSVSTPSLAAGASHSESVGLTFPGNLAPGVYYLGVIADSSGAVAESNESDNESGAVRVILGDDTGNTLSGGSGNDLMFGLGGNDTLTGGDGADLVNGGGGSDTLSYAVAGAGVTVSLAVASAQDTGGAGTDTLVSIENLIGSAFGDSLTGDGGNNVLEGGGGDDSLDGGAGTDTASYASAGAGVTVSLALSGAQDTSGAGIDTLTSIENLVGSAFGDTLTASASGSSLQGGSGDDLLQGGAGNDILDGGAGLDWASYADATAGVKVSLATTAAQNTGGAGTDTLIRIEKLDGSAYADKLTASSSGSTLHGEDGDDLLTSGAGSDEIDGGAGVDTVSYVGAASGVTVDLGLSGAQDTGGGGTDALTSIEKALGSSFDDVLTAAPSGSTLSGMNGNDTLVSGAGADVLNGGNGTDTASYASSASGVTVSLAVTAAQNTGGAGVDKLTAIENLVGSSFDDTLTGDGGDNVLSGGSGNDALDGGAGADTASYADAGAAVTVSLAASGAQNTGGAGTDTLTSIETLEGSAYADRFTAAASGSTLHGAAGNDILYGGAGDDTLDGGAGSDWASYIGATAGVTVSLAISGAQNTGGAGTDTLTGIEKLGGSAYADKLTASSAGSTIYGQGGADLLIGGAGNDYLDGGSGLDAVSYINAASGVTVNLGVSGAQNTGGGGVDTLASIEKVLGSQFDDVLTASASGSTLSGLGGADTLCSGTGKDVMNGGAGNDLFQFSAIEDSKASAPDVIADFTTGDLIDLHLIDADAATAGDQAFQLGAGGHAGDIVVSAYDATHNRTVVSLYVDNDATVDAVIWMRGDHHDLGTGDFVL